jgi:hypothetical protein
MTYPIVGDLVKFFGRKRKTGIEDLRLLAEALLSGRGDRACRTSFTYAVDSSGTQVQTGSRKPLDGAEKPPGRQVRQRFFRYNMPMNRPVQTSRDKTTFSVASLSDADDDKAYWHSKSVRERLQAVELMRQAIYGYEPDSGRLQRFFEVAELTSG